MDRVFLDANVLFSAAYRPGAGLLRLWQLKGIELITSEYAAEEARVNLPDANPRRRLASLLKTVRVMAGIPLGVFPPGVSLVEKDRPILLAAIHAGATHLLTGDQQHFGQYFGRRLGGILILPPGDYLRRRARD